MAAMLPHPAFPIEMGSHKIFFCLDWSGTSLSQLPSSWDYRHKPQILNLLSRLFLMEILKILEEKVF
jgi:hypothetical protein